MKKFIPPIADRDTDELIAIANCKNDNWQREAIDQAAVELKKREVSQEEQQKMLDKWESIEKRLELMYQKQVEKNEFEKYNKNQMIHIFLASPFILSGKWDYDLSYWELKRENYKIKQKQRVILLLGGLIFWILIILLAILT